MSTANFYTMENFPLYCIGDDAFYYEDEEGKEYYDEDEAQYFYDNLTEILEGINNNLLFHKITLKSGYYSGMQFYVEEIHDTLEDLKKYWNNEDCKYQFDLCKSQTIRKYQSEINKINKILKKLAKEHGFNKYGVSAKFSNGEVWYTKVS